MPIEKTIMPTTNTENLQLLDQLPSVISLQMKLLEDWCTEHGWTELQVSGNYKICAVPPGSSISALLPTEAFTQLEKLIDIFEELRELQGLKSLKQSTTKVTLLSSIACIPVVASSVPIRPAIDSSKPPAIVYNLFDCFIILFLILPIISGSFALYGWYKYRKLKTQLANSVVTDSLFNLKDVTESTFMKVINSSTSFTE